MPRVLVIVAHPDDESFGCGSLIATLASAGDDVAVCSATLGQAGEVAPGFDLACRSLAQVRLAELHQAATILGARCLTPLGLLDSGWDGPPTPGSLCATPVDVLADRFGTLIAREQPDVVVTLAADDGHRDHERVTDATTRAFTQAAHPAAELVWWCLPQDLMTRWAEELRTLRPDTAHLSLMLATLGTPANRVTSVVDVRPQLHRRLAAIAAHQSQVSPYEGLSPALRDAFLSTDHLIRSPAPVPG